MFAGREQSFDPQDLAVRLQQQGQAAAVLAVAAHGFMNPLSAHHAPELAQQQLAWLQARQHAWLQRLGHKSG